MGRFTWFPGHMAKALREVQQTLRQADLVLEVRDARVPFTSANAKLEQLLGDKRRIVALNKADLADPGSSKAALARLEARGLRALLTSIQEPGSVKRLLKSAVGRIQSERSHADLSVIMVVGVPNCGKSSLINALKLAARTEGALSEQQAHQRKAKTGPTPGVTLQMASFQVSEQPQAYILDTPGIMMPTIKSDDDALKLALTGAIKDAIVGEHAILQYYIQLLQQPRHAQALNRAMAAASVKAAAATPQSPEHSPPVRASQRQKQVLAAARDVQKFGPLLLQAARADLVAEGWHPGLEDQGFGEGERRLERLMAEMGLVGGTDPSRQEAVVRRLVAAFREGALGRYTLDDV